MTTESAYGRALEAEGERLAAVLAAIRADYDAGHLTVLEAAEARIMALETHLHLCATYRARLLGAPASEIPGPDVPGPDPGPDDDDPDPGAAAVPEPGPGLAAVWTRPPWPADPGAAALWTRPQPPLPPELEAYAARLEASADAGALVPPPLTEDQVILLRQLLPPVPVRRGEVPPAIFLG